MDFNENINPDIQQQTEVKSESGEKGSAGWLNESEIRRKPNRSVEEPTKTKVEVEIHQTFKQKVFTSVIIGLIIGLVAGFVFLGVQHMASCMDYDATTVRPSGSVQVPIQTRPTTPTEPTGPDGGDATDPTEPTGPTDPTEPTEPTEPTNPTDPTQPTEPDPTEPTNPGGDVLIGSTNTVETPNMAVTDVSLVVKNTMSAIVSITNLSIEEVNTVLAGKQQYEYKNSGSGIIVGQNDIEIMIITNNHVVAGNKILTITFVDGSSAKAVVKGADADMDVAVIAVKKSDMTTNALNSIKIAVIGSSDELDIGEPTIVIGNALGYGQSVTCGIVSALDRRVSGFSTSMIQTDAAINPGNSGGALLNAKGEVVGISAAKMIGSTVDNMGYAIPISDVKEVIDEMMSRETRERVDGENRGLLGVVVTNVDSNAEYYFHMPRGAYISQVTAGGAVDVAGICKGSIIIKFDGNKIDSITTLTDILAYYAAGEVVELVIAVPNQYGEYDEQTVSVTLQAPVA